LSYSIDGLIDEACKLKCCKLCRHSWLLYDQDFGYCKHEKNAFGPFPKRIEELGTCPHWEPKIKLGDTEDQH
jgi:hypothetical protein